MSFSKNIHMRLLYSITNPQQEFYNVSTSLYNPDRFFSRYNDRYDVLHSLSGPILQPIGLLLNGAIHLTAGVLAISLGLLTMSSETIGKNGLRCAIFGIAELLTAIIAPFLAIAEVIGRSIASMPRATAVPAPVPNNDVDTDGLNPNLVL